MPLPPLLSERSPAMRAVLTFATPVVGGFLAGATLGLSVAAWVVANVLAVLGGVGAGFEHDSPGGGARRGATGGVCFGLALVLADALVVDHRVATIAKPAILQTVVTVVGGIVLGALGGALRARAARRAAAAVA
jgi:hypothetical protein